MTKSKNAKKQAATSGRKQGPHFKDHGDYGPPPSLADLPASYDFETEFSPYELRSIIVELAKRRNEALRLYEPMPIQQAFHQCMSRQRVIRGSNRCLAGEQEIYDPVAKRMMRVDQIKSDFHVWSFNEATKEFEIKRASKPFVKGFGSLYRIQASQSGTLYAAMEHRILLSNGTWASIGNWTGKGFVKLVDDSGATPVEIGESNIMSLEYLRHGDIWDIMVEDNHNYVAGGVISHNSGKTTANMCEVARALTGTDPLKRYPSKGVCYIVAKDERAIGEVIYKKLFKAGAFKMIRDEITDEWRTFRPVQDEHRKHLAKPAPPLIPPRLIKPDGATWVKKKAGIPRLIKLVTGWEVHFFSSNAEPPQGVDVNLVSFSEEIINRKWYPELCARLVDHSGHFIWDATPQAGTEQLFDLHEKAEALVEKGVPEAERSISEFYITLENNIHLTDKQKQEFEDQLEDEDEVAVRVKGHFAIKSLMIYPEWNDRLHIVPCREIPSHWTRYASIDPGRTVCAVLFGAVPPPDDKDYHEGDFYIYDEIYIPDSDTKKFGRAMKEKAGNQNIYAFIIDNSEGRKDYQGFGRTVYDQYADALTEQGVRSQATGSHFAIGDANLKAGIQAVRTALLVREDETCPLKTFKEKCPHFCEEMKRYRYVKDRALGVITEKVRKKNDHTCDAVRYLVQHGLYWHPPRAGDNVLRGAYHQLQEHLNEQRGRSSQYPGIVLG